LRARREASNHHRRRKLNLRRLAGCEREVGCGKVEAASHQPVRHEHQRRQQHQRRLDRALHVAQQKFGAGREPDEAHRVIVDEVGEAGAIVVREHPEHVRPSGSTSDEVAGDQRQAERRAAADRGERRGGDRSKGEGGGGPRGRAGHAPARQKLLKKSRARELVGGADEQRPTNARQMRAEEEKARTPPTPQSSGRQWTW